MKKTQTLKNLPARKIRGLFFDLDETFSTQGKITAEAYQALWDLKKAGKILVPITGRPAGWCDHIARMWPVDAVIGENGAFYFMMKDGAMRQHYIAERGLKSQLAAIQEEILQKVPGAGIASDQNYREFDLAIDYCEDVPRLGQDKVDQIVAIFKKHGATTKVSSVHVNAWFGTYNKLTAAKIFAKNELGISLDKANADFAFCGDSPNDEPLFEYFVNSVGVANVQEFQDSLRHPPRFITPSRSGKGFCELAESLLTH